MQFSSAALSCFLLSVGSAVAFSGSSTKAFVPSRSITGSAAATTTKHNVVGTCKCAACMMPARAFAVHGAACACASCSGRTGTALFAVDGEDAAEAPPAEEPVAVAVAAPAAEAETATAEVPAEVQAMDGIESGDEAHNADRPARKALKKKKGKDLAEFKVGDTIQAKVKSLTSYGAFIDIGAATDGLLHISQLSVGYVADVKDVLSDGQDVEVRITKIDADKNQVALSMLTVAQEEEANDAANSPRKAGGNKRGGGGGGGRRDDSAILSALSSKGWNTDTFVEGTVVSTVDFGCFVRVNAALLNPEVEGEMDGLVHISALSVGRVNQVTNIVNVDDKVQVRVKGIADRKVSLSMISPEDEAEKGNNRGGGGEVENMGAKDWKESLEKMTKDMPAFTNGPMVVDSRK